MNTDNIQHISFRKFIEDANNFSWVLQVVQEVYAFALDIPLRIFQRNQAELFWDKAANKSIEFQRRFPSQAIFDKFATDISLNPDQGFVQLASEEIFWESLLTRDQEIWWVTQQSNGHPLCQMLAEHRYWRWWEFFYYYHQLILNQHNNITSIIDYPKFGNDFLYFSFQSALNDENLIILAGPVWKPANRATGEHFERNHVEPIIDRFLAGFKQITDNARYREPIYERGQFLLRGTSRYPISSSDLFGRLEQVANALSCLLKMKVPTESELRRCDYVGLAEWSVFVICEMEQLQYAPKYRALRVQGAEDSMLSVYYRLDHSLKPGQPTSKEGSSWVNTTWPLSGETSSPYLKLSHAHPYAHTELSKESSRLLLHPPVTNALRNTPGLLSDFECALSRFLGRLATEKHHGRTETQLALRAWLNDHFGILTSVGQEADETVKKVSNYLCKLVSRSLIADIVTLYRYDYGSQQLNVQGLFFSGSQKEDWEKTMDEIMKKTAHSNQEERRRSIAYRAIDLAEAQFTRCFDQTQPDESSAIPSDKPLLSVPTRFRSAQSAIAVPVSVYGRPWGTLEVLGFRAYQFRWDNLSLVEEFADILSPFFYHQWFLARLDSLNSIATTGGNLTEKYNTICANLAGLFLSYGAAFWVLEPFNKDRFVCWGCHNHPALSDTLKSDTEPLIYYTNSILNQIKNEIQKNKQDNRPIWWHSVIGEGLLNDKWLELSHNKDLGYLKINTKTIIPVFNQETSEETSRETNTVIAFISLYNQTKIPFNSRWQHLVTFVTRYIALLLRATRVQHDWECRARSFIAHEMKTQADNLQDRAKALVELTKTSFQLLDEPKRRRAGLIIKDLDNYSKDIKQIISLFASPEFGRILLEGIDPIFFLARQQMVHDRDATWLNLYHQFKTVFLSNQNWMQERGITWRYFGPNESNSPHIRIYARNLREILDNLCTNAIKYAVNGSEIYVSITQTEYVVRLSITNIGICLGEGDEERIFSEGFRGSNSEGIRGEGKGLFITRGICEMYQIGLRYQSQPVVDKSRPNCCRHVFTLSFPNRLFH